MKTIKDFEPLLPAEQLLLDACKAGRPATIGDGKRPTKKEQNTNEIRAEFLRSLILTERESIDQKGIQFHGAYVSGSFDFDSCETNLPFWFLDSFFQTKIILSGSRIKHLSLNGSAIVGLNANRAKIEDGVWMRNSFVSNGEINFSSATIKNNFSIENALLNNTDGIALNCDKIKVGGGIFLRNGFKAIGEVKLLWGEIGSSLDCVGGFFKASKNGIALNCHGLKVNGSVFLSRHRATNKFSVFKANGMVDFLSSSIAVNFTCDFGIFNNPNKVALNCDKMSVGGGFFTRKTKISGVLNLTVANLGILSDNRKFWNQIYLKHIILNGCTYTHIDGGSHNVKDRKQWLTKMPKFEPQPYKQLAKVLRDMGHISDANEIMIEYHDKRSKEFKSGLKKSFFWFYRSFSDYGYSPSKVVKWMFWVWLVCSIVYWHAANTGVFAPSNPIVFQNVGYAYNCSPKEVGFRDIIYKEENGSKNWYYSSLKGEYTTFQPFLYSLDVILPVVDLYMEKDWGVYIPTSSGYFDWLNPSTITFNHIVRLIVWLEILFGWALSLILVAILSGLAKNEKD